VYDYHKILDCLYSLGLKKKDKLYIHSNLTFYGRMKDIYSKEQLAEAWTKALFEVVGEKSNIIIPLFSYSSCNHKIFKKEDMNFKMGILNEYLFSNLKFKRTNDPIYSSGFYGTCIKDIKKIDIKNSFSKNSVFSYILKNDFKILSLNHIGTTFLHYLERKYKVKYRFDKKFEGRIRNKKTLKKIYSKIFVCYRSDPYLHHNPNYYYKEAKKSGIIISKKLGNGLMDISSSKKVDNFIKFKIKSNEFFLTNANKIKNYEPKIIEEKKFQKWIEK